MKTTTVTEAKAQLSRLLELVRRGESILILHRGQPIARLVPAGPAEPDAASERLGRLERLGVVRRPQAAARPDGDEAASRPPLAAGRSLLEALLEERENGR